MFVKKISDWLHCFFRPGRVESHGSGSNRTSLVVTHEDGSVEDLETEVTCLGLSMDRWVKEHMARVEDELSCGFQI